MKHRLGMLVTLILGSLSSACSYANVESGQVAVVWTTSGTNTKVLQEGSWGIGYYDKATYYNARSQEREERLEVLAANGLRIVLDSSVRYHIVPEEAVALDRELGTGFYSILLGPTLRSQSRRVVGRYQPEEIYSTQREVIERLIREGVEAAIKGRHVVLEAVLIRNVTLPDTIQRAINTKLEAEQQALKMKYVIAEAQSESEKKLLEIKADAERKKIETDAEMQRQKAQAEARSETTRIDAEAGAAAKRIDAQATNDYVRIVQEHMTEAMLRWQQIQATSALSASPNSKLIFMGSGKTPTALLDIK